MPALMSIAATSIRFPRRLLGGSVRRGRHPNADVSAVLRRRPAWPSLPAARPAALRPRQAAPPRLRAARASADARDHRERCSPPQAAGALDVSAATATTTSGEREDSERDKPGRDVVPPEYIWSLVKDEWPRLWRAAIALVIGSSCSIAQPVLSGRFFQSVIARDWAAFEQVIPMILFGYVLEVISTFVYVRNITSAGERGMVRFRERVFASMLRQKVEFFDRHKTAELTGLLNTEIGNIRSVYMDNVSRDRGMRALVESVGAMSVLFAMSFKLAPVLVILVSCCGVSAALYSRATKKIFGADAKARDNLTDMATQTLSSIRTVRSFAGEELEMERFGEFALRSSEQGRAIGSAKAMLEMCNRASIYASLMCLYMLGGYLVRNGFLPISVLVSSIGFTFTLIFAIQGLVNSGADFRKAAASLDRIRHTLDAAPDASLTIEPEEIMQRAYLLDGIHHCIDPASNDCSAAVSAAKAGDIEVEDVHFSYPTRADVPVLKGVSLQIERGSMTALVGRSGSGKSTLVQLLSRFYEPAMGKITLAGVPVSRFTREEWARAVALVSQEPNLFDGTVADNIAYGARGECGIDDVIVAAKAANAHDFISSLPDGYDTMLGERGMQLSGGQRQRVAIARALLKDSPILILDEATSALDTVSERLVQEALDRLVVGRTVLVIAHRLSTIQKAEKIVVMQDGHVQEQGTHGQLVAEGGIYADLVSGQQLSLLNA